MAEEKDVLLKIKVDSEKALQAVKQYTGEVESLKRTQNNLKLALKELEQEREREWKAYKKGEKSIQDYNKVAEESRQTEARIKEQLAMNSAQLANTSQNLRGYQKELQNVLKQQEALANGSDGSLASLRAELSNLTKEYDNLARTEREAAKGTDLLNKINELTNEIKDAEEATQRYQRNVGNYRSALKEAEKASEGMRNSFLGIISGGNPMIEMFANTAQQLGSVKQAFSVAGKGAVMLGKQMMALVMTPIGAFLTLVTALIMAFKAGLESSEERMNRFKTVTAPLQGLLDGISDALGTLCDWLLTFCEWQQKAIDWSLKLIATISGWEWLQKGIETRNEYIAIEKQRQEIEKQTRDEVVKTAQREKEVSELRAKFAEKDKYTNEQRLEFLNKAIAKEKEQAEANKRIAEMKLDNLKREAAMSDNNAEMNNKLAQAEAEVLKQEKALSDKMRELNAQRVEAVNSIKAYRKERADKEQEAVRAAEDALNELIKDNYNKQIAQRRTQYEREQEDLKKQLADKSKLTAEAEEAIRTQLSASEQKYYEDIAAIQDDQTQRLAKLELDTRLAELHGNEKAILATKIQAKQEEIATMYQLESESDAEFNLRRLQAQNELADMQKQQRTTTMQEEIEAKALALQTELELIKQKNITEQQMEMEALQTKLDAKAQELEEMHRLEGESQEEFNLRKLQTENEYADMKKQIDDKIVANEKAKAKAQRDAYNSVMQAMTAMGEHSKALGKIGKIMGLAQIAVDTGKAISSGIAEAVKAGPFPKNLAAIATTVATVLANMATAMSSIKSAKFATGGLVQGAGSGTSDSIPAMLSNGESVMTAQATSTFAPLLSAINQMGGGVPINVTQVGSQQMGEDMLARAVARGVAELHPVVSVEEINRVSNNVRAIESLATV